MAAKLRTDWRETFLDLLREKPVVSYAAKEAGVHRSTVMRHYDRDKEFAEQFDEAMEDGIDQVELDLLDVGNGEKRGQVGALIYYLKVRRYEKRGDLYKKETELTIGWDDEGS